MTDKMLSRKEGAVGYVVFNNPERHNAASLEMWQRLHELFDGFRDDPEIRVVVITGAGGKAFVAGADISKFGDERATEAGIARYNAAIGQAFTAVHDFPKPTIAMIRGYCIGGGMALAACCDLRIATPGSKFAIPAAKLGLGYDFEGVDRLMNVVGPSFAKEIFFTARHFDAEEVHQMGFLNRIVPDAELDGYVKSYADTIAGNAPLTIAAAKLAAGELLKDESARDMKAVNAAILNCFGSKDYIEGRTAFMEKRKPVFTGR